MGRWVGEDQAGFLTAEERTVDLLIPRIPADDPVPTELPDVTKARDDRQLHRRHARLGLALSGFLVRFLEDEVDLAGIEPHEVEVELNIDKGLKFGCEKIPVPSRLGRKLVIGQDIGAPLIGREMGLGARSEQRPCSRASRPRSGHDRR